MENFSEQELADMQAARMQTVKENAACCDICASDWFQAIDYTKLDFKTVSDEERANLALLLSESSTESEQNEAFLNLFGKDLAE
jgi:hypothetical protein